MWAYIYIYIYIYIHTHTHTFRNAKSRSSYLLSPGRDYNREHVEVSLKLAQLPQACGLRLGEPSKQRGEWATIVLAQARAPRLSKSFRFEWPTRSPGRVQQSSPLSLVQQQVHIIIAVQTTHFHTTNNTYQPSST